MHKSYSTLFGCAAVFLLGIAACKESPPPAQPAETPARPATIDTPSGGTTTAAAPAPSGATQPQGGNLGNAAEGPLAVIHGKVVEAGPDKLVVDGKSGTPLRIVIEKGTRVKVDGKPATMAAIRQGLDVSAAYRTVNNVPTATDVEASTGKK